MIKSFYNIFKLPEPIQVAINELAEAELSLLKAEAGVDYATSLVIYNKARVKRLKAYITGER